MSLTQVQTGMISGVPIQVSTNNVVTTINANNTSVLSSTGNVTSLIAGSNTFITSNGTTTTISANNASAINIDAFQNSTFANTVKTNTISSTPTNALNIQTAGTTAVTIDTSQNIAIGTTTNSGRLLQVNQPSGYTSGVRVLSGGSGAYYEMFSGTNNIKIGADASSSSFQWYFDGVNKGTLGNGGSLNISGSITYAGSIQTGSFTFSGGGTQNILTIPTYSMYLFWSQYNSYGGSDNRHGIYYLAGVNPNGGSGTQIAALSSSGGFSINSSGVVSYSAGGGNPYTTIFWMRLV